MENRPAPPRYTEQLNAQQEILMEEPKPQTTIITSNPTVVIVQTLGTLPSHCYCAVCNLQVVTRVETTASCRTHLFAGILCLFICWPCAWMPYCIDSCKKTVHFCPYCNTCLGTD